VNISTMAALVTAGAGRRVVKHGNRAASSASGTADVLEELGVVIDLPPTGVAACVERVGIGFCFAPVFHPGMRHAGAVRRELGVPTIFNFLGPLTNPARPAAAAVGCADQRMAPVMAAVLARRGDRAMVFRGEDGLDELTTTTASQVWVAGPGGVSEHRLDPTRLGIAAAPPEALRGGGPSENATVVRDLAAGRLGPVRDAVVLNAAAAIAAFDSAAIATFDAAATAAYDAGVDPAADGPLEDRIAAGLEIASAAIDSGAVQAVLDHWIAVSTELRPG
jgi:anthranilate phosphoribosyltransferase